MSQKSILGSFLKYMNGVLRFPCDNLLLLTGSMLQGY
jgi:hypothetical protein